MMCERHGATDKPGLKLVGSLQHLFAGADESNSSGNKQKAASNVPGPDKHKRRLKLWELEERLHCPVVGTCLTVDELKKIARKEGYAGKKIAPYQLHVEAVSVSCERNSTAENMHKLLEKKYARWIKLFEQAKTSEALLKLWNVHFGRGEVGGVMWAVLTHRQADEAVRRQVYGDVHMLSHQVGACIAADTRKLSFLEAEVSRLRSEARQDSYRVSHALGEKTVTIRQLEEENRQLNSKLDELRAYKERAEALESGQVMADMGRRLLLLESINAKQQEALRLAQQRICQLEREAGERARLDKELTTLSAERDALERLLRDELELAMALTGRQTF